MVIFNSYVSLPEGNPIRLIPSAYKTSPLHGAKYVISPPTKPWFLRCLEYELGKVLLCYEKPLSTILNHYRLSIAMIPLLSQY